MTRTDADALIMTLDIDWAPDFVIDEIAASLVGAGVKATWFVTHASPAVDRLKARPDLFELGLHPNFLPGSTHGATPAAALRHCLELVPQARSFRSHGLVQSTAILDLAIEHGLEADVSLYLPHARRLAPVEHWRGGRCLWRVPYMWEDDFEMDRPAPLWSLKDLLGHTGLKVLDFHPIHVWLNGADMSAYAALKQRFPNLPAATPAGAEPLRRHGAGPGRMFAEVVRHLAAAGQSWCIRDLLPAPAEAAA